MLDGDLRSTKSTRRPGFVHDILYDHEERPSRLEDSKRCTCNVKAGVSRNCTAGRCELSDVLDYVETTYSSSHKIVLLWSLNATL